MRDDVDHIEALLSAETERLRRAGMCERCAARAIDRIWFANSAGERPAIEAADRVARRVDTILAAGFEPCDGTHYIASTG